VTTPPHDLAARRVFVTVGSDHHRFDRLVRWVDAWTRERGLGADEVLVQHGPADPPVTAAGVDFIPHDTLLRLMHDADVVVTQGGPMSMVEARQQGRRPIVLPRTASLAEVVDDHQHAFCQRVASEGWIQLVSAEADLHAALDAAIADPAKVRIDEDPDHVATVRASISRFGRIADAVLDTRRRSVAGRPTVLVLGGLGRSGSTLLERALGETPGVAALGEVLHLWERGLVEDQRCGCGEPFSSCPFWRGVGARAFGGWGEVDPSGAFEDRRSVVRNRHVVALVTGVAAPAWRLRRARLTRRTSSVFAAASEVAGAGLLIDSSKHPAYAIAVRRCLADVRGVLVVRDPRGVAYSWSKTVVRPEIDGGQAHMPRYGVVASTLRWSLYAVLFEALRLLRVPVMVVRYEDLLRDPPGTVGSVLAFAGRPDLTCSLEHLSVNAIELGTHHTVAGNPMRFQTGRVELLVDEAWRTAMSVHDRAVVSRLTTTLRRRYGYRDA